MADAAVIPFPAERRVPREGELESASAAGEPFVALSVEILELPTIGQVPAADVVRRARARCAAAAAETLSALGLAVRIAGTARHPVVEARVEGEGATERAAEGALVAARAVWLEQRPGPCRMVLSGGMATGRRLVMNGDISVTRGAAESHADHLREEAAPGQVLARGDGWEDAVTHALGGAGARPAGVDDHTSRRLQSVR